LTGRPLKLYPLPAQEIVGGIYEDLEFPLARSRSPSRPFVIINVVSSLDGRTAIGGKSSRIGSATDRQAMRTLRSKAGAVMIGAGTLRAERLSLGLDEPTEEPQPLAVVATRSGDVPLEQNLILGERQSLLVITAQELPEYLRGQLGVRARVVPVPANSSGAVDLGAALIILKSEYGVELLLVEGGPSLNHALVSANLADELFLTLAPKLLGGTPDKSLASLDGPTLGPRDINLLSAHLAGNELFLRYALYPLEPDHQ
jgi:riboflavin-specific deaminase-like protein